MANTNKYNSSYHPDYMDYCLDWNQMDDTISGEREVKESGTTYLPKTEGQKNDNQNGSKRYENYKLRANFFNYVSDTSISMLGVMHSEAPGEVAVPARIEPLLENTDLTGDNIYNLQRRINNNQVNYGRYGLWVSVPDGEGPDINPYIVEYKWNKIINWNEVQENGKRILKFVVLDESKAKFNIEKNEWEWVDMFRLLALDANGEYYTRILEDKDLKKAGNILYPPDVIDENGNEIDIYPNLAGKKLDYIPFTFVNTTHLHAEPEKPPLLSLSNICLAIYRGEADYRQTLFMQGQDTVFGTGFTAEELKLGAGAATIVESKEATLQYVGATSDGLERMEVSQEDLHKKAQNAGIALIDQSQQESGEALKTRLAIKTASMKTIAITGAAAIIKTLKIIADWTNSNKEEVVFIPNLDFSKSNVTAQEVLQLWTGRQTGMPLSKESIHEYLRRHDFTTKSFDEEMELIEAEDLL